VIVRPDQRCAFALCDRTSGSMTKPWVTGTTHPPLITAPHSRIICVLEAEPESRSSLENARSYERLGLRLD